MRNGKREKCEANYQPHNRSQTQFCKVCRFLDGTHNCLKVSGRVSYAAVCNLFLDADSKDTTTQRKIA
jgi:hypothetical protein